MQTDNTGDIYGYPEYERTDKIYYEGEEVPVYLWYYGDVQKDTTLQWWVISSSSLEEAAAVNGSVGVYGFCEAAVANPVDCAAGWRFFFVDNFALDESFALEGGECAVETTDEPVVWPEYICIESTEKDSSYLPTNYFVGGYQINETGTDLSGNVPHWVKPRNDDWRYHDVYLYLDGFYGWWQVHSFSIS